jgi:glucose-6-phosphate isomerase
MVGDAHNVLDRLVSDGIPRALTAGNSHLWGPDAAGTAARRLGWLDLPESSRVLLPRLADLRPAGLERVVLAGLGGSALGPEVIARSGGIELTVLDTTDPHHVAALIGSRLDRTVVVLSSEGGDAIEIDSHRRIFEQAFRDAGITGEALRRRFVVVTDPGSPLEAVADAAGYQVVRTDPRAGGRYGALGASGLVPSALAGADVAGLLDEAADLAEGLRRPLDNPGLALGAALGGPARHGRDKIAIVDDGSGLGSWVEHLIAESTGKDGRGIVPVVVEGADAPGFEAAAPIRRVAIGPAGAGLAKDVELGVSGPLGGQFLLWEYATAVAGRILGVNPFDQPDIQESTANMAALLRGVEEGAVPTILAGEPALVVGAVEIHAPGGLLKGATDLESAFDSVLMAVPDQGYLAIMAFLDKGTPGSGAGDEAAARLRPLLAARAAQIRRTPVPVTFGWGPQFLHTTGQLHKGGPQNGVFLQVTGAVSTDVAVPGKVYTLKSLQLAQAFGDLRVLRSHGRPAVRVHLHDRAEGLDQLLTALKD